MKQPLEPTLVADLFPDLMNEILRVWRLMVDDEWEMPTICTGWSVKDVAIHMLGDVVGILSGIHDKHSFEADVDSWKNLVVFINQRNEEWVTANRRLSVPVLCSLMDTMSKELNDYFQAVDPFSEGVPISWAGDDITPMWMEIAREYTEFWVHHQHICDAIGKISLRDERFMRPLCAIFVRAMPHAYRDVAAKTGTTIQLSINGVGGDTWYLVRESDKWLLYSIRTEKPLSVITMDSEAAWRLFTKGIDRQIACQQMTFSGDVSLCEPILEMVSIIA